MSGVEPGGRTTKAVLTSSNQEELENHTSSNQEELENHTSSNQEELENQTSSNQKENQTFSNKEELESTKAVFSTLNTGFPYSLVTKRLNSYNKTELR